MKNKLALFTMLFLASLLFFTIIWGTIYKTKEYNKTIKTLISMNPRQVTTFRVYPKVDLQPYGTPVVFNIPDSIIDEFFHSLTDIRSFHPIGRCLGGSAEQSWFLEVATGDNIIQLGFNIPSQIGGFFGYTKGGEYCCWRSYQI